MEINSVLPDEMLEGVFTLLPLHTLMVVVAVCRRWREVGEAPWLWTRARLRVTGENLLEVPGVLAGRRWMALGCLVVREVSHHLLTAIIQHPGLKRLEINYVDLSPLAPEELATAVGGREEVDLRSSLLTTAQASTIFLTILTGCRLRSLEIGPMTNLSTLEPSMLARAVNRLERVEMKGCQVSREQVEAILEESRHTRLQVLDLR